MIDPDTAAPAILVDAGSSRGPAWYAAEAVRIARLDTTAMQRASRDRAAIAYGAVIATLVMVVRGVIELGTVSVARDVPPEAGMFAVVLSGVIVLALAVPLQLGWSALTTAVMHGAAKVLFGATGSYTALLRVLWMGSIVQLFAVLPIVGSIVAGLWMLLVTLVVFEEVDGIERLQALVLAVGFVALMSVIGLAFG